MEFGNSTKYALLGEWNKWTAISCQRIKVIDNQTNINQAVITIQGLPGETVPFLIFHSTLLSVTVNCRISSDIGQAQIVVSSSKVDCY